MFFEIFSFPKVNQCAIITYEDGIHVFARGMPIDLRHRTLGNWKISEKCLKFIE